MTPVDYLPLAAAINRQIDAFNRFLDSAHHLGHISLEHPSTSHWIEGTQWGGHTWPSKDSYGVYFLVGHRVDSPSTHGLYIGKASFGKRIGHRLHTHLLHGQETKSYFKTAPDGSQFQIQMLFAVPMPTDQMKPFGPALEEHLIHTLRGEMYLLNRVGNK
jgi:hypothetical protein